jgi:lactam utilization protein B
MEGYCSTGQSPQRAVVPVEEVRVHHLLYQLNALYELIQTLNEFVQHISVHVYHLQGEHNVSS